MSHFYQSPPKSKVPEGRQLIIFDFDGVLADSFEAFYQLIGKSMAHIGLNLTKKQYQNFHIGNVHAGFKNFIKDQQKYLAFLKFRKANYDKYYKKVRLFPGVVKVLKKLSQDYILSIASSGKQNQILRLFKKRQADKMFDTVLGTTEYTKKNMLKQIMKKRKTSPEHTIMITDTVGDILVAKKVGLKTLAVTWGFHSKKILAQAKPDKIVSDIKNLPAVLTLTK